MIIPIPQILQNIIIIVILKDRGLKEERVHICQPLIEGNLILFNYVFSPFLLRDQMHQILQGKIENLNVIVFTLCESSIPFLSASYTTQLPILLREYRRHSSLEYSLFFSSTPSQ